MEAKIVAKESKEFLNILIKQQEMINEIDLSIRKQAILFSFLLFSFLMGILFGAFIVFLFSI
jgi:hypothetical protein